MATTTSTIPAFMDALRSQLLAREGLAGVEVFTGPMGEDTPREAIVLFGTDASQEWGAIGNRRRDESYTVEAATWVKRPGAGEAAIKEARDRAFELIGEVENQLRTDPKANGTILKGAVSGMVLLQGIDMDGRWAQVAFTIACDALLPRS
ncbi:MAG: hypothetical protein AB7E55_19810 [Pigmentiphaga sp.]